MPTVLQRHSLPAQSVGTPVVPWLRLLLPRLLAEKLWVHWAGGLSVLLSFSKVEASRS